MLSDPSSAAVIRTRLARHVQARTVLYHPSEQGRTPARGVQRAEQATKRRLWGSHEAQERGRRDALDWASAEPAAATSAATVVVMRMLRRSVGR